ncbi:hypothetical protein FQN54_001673 [Arachnomyces sp. PD_36]|nr:hypothetical protein FQN54_001673 [Arachnomyces sp. PD_36]
MSSGDGAQGNGAQSRKRQRTSYALEADQMNSVMHVDCAKSDAMVGVPARHVSQEERIAVMASKLSQTLSTGTKIKESFRRGKSDLILDVTMRSEKLLQEMSSTMSTLMQMQGARGPVTSPQTSSSSIAADSARHASGGYHGGHDDDISNAMISSFHQSTTEAVLAWSIFDKFPSLCAERSISFFNLEKNRPSLPERTTTGVRPYLAPADVRSIALAFQKNVNFWYPVMSHARVKQLETKVNGVNLEPGAGSCLAMLMMALGCASEAAVHTGSEIELDEAEHTGPSKSLGGKFFDVALTMIHFAHMETSAEATQCLFYMGLYLAFLQRPLQAWSFINSTATKCRLLLSYMPSETGSEDNECIRRIFWSCFILESDYLAELSALPPSGIGEIESSVPLPGHFHTHESEDDQQQSSLYFLACISMRRILNRVHHLLYAKGTGAVFDHHRLPSVVNELDHQLEEWRDFLPTQFQFSVDTLPASNQQAAFLRQRYLTCRSVIYRPYLTLVLVNSQKSEKLAPVILEKSKLCLDACLLHALNLRGFTHTVMMDTWICSLSMAGVMLTMLAACQHPYIKQHIGTKATSIGTHLVRLLSRWMHITSDPVSPSVDRSVKLIIQVDGLIQKEYLVD